MQNNRYASIIVDVANAEVDRVFDYIVPEGMQLPEGAQILSLPMETTWLRELPDINEMREVYKSLRRIIQRPVHYGDFNALVHLVQSDSGLPDVCCAASMLILNDMKLIGLDLDQKPIRMTLGEMRKTDPETSAVWRAVQSWRTQEA